MSGLGFRVYRGFMGFREVTGFTLTGSISGL